MLSHLHRIDCDTHEGSLSHDRKPAGMVLGLLGIAAVVLSWIAAHYLSWFFPRGLQHLQEAITRPAKLVTLDRLIPKQHYTRDQISPHFWPNGKMPEREDWKQLASDNFKSYRLKVGGLVENPVELSLEELRALGKEENITMLIASRAGPVSLSGEASR